MLRKLALTVAAAGALGLAATATPANAVYMSGLKAPAVESNVEDIRCWHRRRWSGWVCTPGPRYHRRWRSRRW